MNEFISTPSYRNLSRDAVRPPYPRLYGSVFSLLPANVRVESRIVNGSEFQSEGPEMAKLHDQYRECNVTAPQFH